MQRARLGNTSLDVSRLCFGCGLLDHIQARLTPEVAAPVLRRAFELGVTFWDTADEYRSHPHVREGLKLVGRENVVLATKTQATDYATATADVERFCRELGTDYLDVVHLHAVDSPEEYVARAGALAALRDAQTRGLVRSVGLSTHSVSTARILPRAGRDGIEVALVVLNKTGHTLKSGTISEMESAVAAARESGIGIYTMKVLGQGASLADYSLSELFAHNLSLSYVDALVVGMITAREVEQNVAIVEKLDARGT
jgi:uncharacterized protein